MSEKETKEKISEILTKIAMEGNIELSKDELMYIIPYTLQSHKEDDSDAYYEILELLGKEEDAPLRDLAIAVMQEMSGEQQDRGHEISLMLQNMLDPLVKEVRESLYEVGILDKDEAETRAREEVLDIFNEMVNEDVQDD